MNWFKDRAGEPSTWGGLSLLIYGLGELFKISEAAPVAETVAQGGQSVAGGDYAGGITIMVGGILAALLGEKGSKK